MNELYSGKVGLVQRVLPSYRAPFFEALGGVCSGGLGLFAGQARPSESILPAHDLEGVQLTPAHNINCLHGRFYFCWQTDLLTWLKAWHPDILIVEANPRYLSTPRALRWMHAQDKPVIGWGLGAPVQHGALTALSTASRSRFLKQFDALITYSQSGAEEYQALGITAESIFIAVNAVTARPKQAMPKRPRNFTGKPRILFVGRLQARKRIDNLLRACAALPSALQPDLLIVGEGPAKSELETLAKGIYPSAKFLGAKYGQDLAAYFEKADLFVLPGTGGLAVQQAMSYGLPVVVAEADGTQDDLVRPQNGWQIPPQDVGALQHTLQEALSDVSRLRRMGTASYRIVSDEINLENMVTVFLKAIRYVNAQALEKLPGIGK